MSDDDKQWLDWQRGDVLRDLVERGWDHADAKAQMDALSDEAFQIIRSKAVNELAECYIAGMRSTIRIREALKYAADMRPEDTERAKEFRRKRAESLAAFERRDRKPHDCESCSACLHDGNKCCGCYDGACCQEPHDDRTPGGSES